MTAFEIIRLIIVCGGGVVLLGFLSFLGGLLACCENIWLENAGWIMIFSGLAVCLLTELVWGILKLFRVL